MIWQTVNGPGELEPKLQGHLPQAPGSDLTHRGSMTPPHWFVKVSTPTSFCCAVRIRLRRVGDGQAHLKQLGTQNMLSTSVVCQRWLALPLRVAEQSFLSKALLETVTDALLTGTVQFPEPETSQER